MPSSLDIPSDAVILRHIPGTLNYQKPPEGRITSNNFQLRPHETGLSVSISKQSTQVEDAAHLLAILNTTPTSRIAAASFQSLKDFGLAVIRDPTPNDPNHAELVPESCDLSNQATRKKLAQKFEYCTSPLPPK